MVYDPDINTLYVWLNFEFTEKKNIVELFLEQNGTVSDIISAAGLESVG
jgi:putative ubiquitin-RnfH superfamily antitoxin RatB of RatAB toxin-antitoxin module